MSVTFEHPYVTPTLTLTLRNPELGNSEQLDIKTQFHLTMSGNIHSHKRTPMNQRLLLQFSNLTKAKLEELQTFIETSSGDEVKYTDHNAVMWRGYILTNPVEGRTERKIVDGTCVESYSVGIEFQGEQP